ncbi:transposase domain-containing protein [Streptomyces erythrochromogenes]
MIDAVLATCGAVRERTRNLPARVVVCLLLAAGLGSAAARRCGAS